MVYLILGTIIFILWIVMYFLFHNREFPEINAIGENEFFMQQLFFIGLGVCEIINVKHISVKARKKIIDLDSLKGAGKGQAYYATLLAGKITYAITFLQVVLFLTVIINEVVVVLLGLLFVVLMGVYLDYEINSQTNDRKEEITNELPNLLSKIAVLMSSGLTLRSCWNSISNSDNKELYREINILREEMNNGVSELEAYKRLGERCNYKEVKKLVSTLSQNLQKGNSDVIRLIRELADNSWQEKKYKAKIKGEVAGSKLMIPMIIMLVSVLIMIIVPIFDSL